MPSAWIFRGDVVPSAWIFRGDRHAARLDLAGDGMASASIFHGDVMPSASIFHGERRAARLDLAGDGMASALIFECEGSCAVTTGAEHRAWHPFLSATSCSRGGIERMSPRHQTVVRVVWMVSDLYGRHAEQCGLPPGVSVGPPV